MHNLTCITTCKGRLRHLSKSLPRLLAAGFSNIVVVDYGCPDGTAAWLEKNHPRVDVVKVDDDPGFHLTRARNIGAARVGTEWMFFIDADVLVDDRLPSWLSGNLRGGHFYRPGRRDGGFKDRETYGSFICERKVFNKLGGYDEVMTGWGGEDVDFFRMLDWSGAEQVDFPCELLSAIHHGDAARARFYDGKDIVLNHLVNKVYIQIKDMYWHFQGKPTVLEKDVRERMMRLARESVHAWDAAGREDSRLVATKLRKIGRLESDYQFEARVAFELMVEHVERSR